MKGHPDVIKVLNEVLVGELTAINQYFLHSRICEDWGYTKLAKVIYHESIDEMKHAQTLVDRILFLEGLPNMQKLGKLRIGETVEEQLKSDLALEFEALNRLKDGIKVCIDASDFATGEILEHILIDEEKHVDWLESQLNVIKDVGIENYLVQQTDVTVGG